MPKDRDVWEPPEDLEPPELPQSEFKLHFQGRAVLVGKDGSNAQLVQMKEVKPIKWSNGKKDEPSVKRPLRILNHNRGVSGTGIVAPDEVLEPSRKPLPRRAEPRTIIGGNDMIANETNTNQVKSRATDVCGGITRRVIESSEKNVYSRAPNGSSHSSNDRKVAKTVNRQEDVCKRSTPEIISVEPIENKVVPTGNQGGCTFSAPETSHPLIDKLVEKRHQPIARLPPRRLIERDDLMPKPSKIVTGYVGEKQKCVKGDIDNNTNEEEPYDHSINLDTSGGSHEDLEVLPMYKPLGLLFSPLQLIKKNAIIKTNQKRCPVPGQRACKPNPSLAPVRQNANTRPSTENAQRPARSVSPCRALSTLSQTTPPTGALRCEPIPAASSAQTNATPVEDPEKQKQKPITYKPHTMKDYKDLMGKLANMKRGGLGPADTDEQRQAKEKMVRQREYGERVERQIAEELHEKHQQRLAQLQEGTEETSPQREMVRVIKQPPPPERIQAQERRARALEYARNVPRPEPATAPKSADEECDEVYLSPVRRNPQDDRVRQREKRIRDLEVRHQSDRETLEYVKKQLGYFGKK